MSDVSYAVLAKTKAKFGKRLKEKDYKNLVECESVAEVMSYLKTNTHYKDAFGEANERDIHRELFENLLKQYQTIEFDAISRYDLSVGEHFSTYIACKTEINEIIRFLTILNSKKKRQFTFNIPPHLEKRTAITLSILINATTYEEFLAAIKGTQYEVTLKEFDLEHRTSIPIAEIEDKLFIQLYENLYKSIRLTHGDEYEELKELFDTIMDIENFARILRLKKYHNTNSNLIKEYLLPFGTLSKKQLNIICEAENSDEAFSAMEKTKYGKIINKTNFTYESELISAIKLQKARHNMYFSDNPTTVMLSYIILSELEVINLITIIEGIRYGLDKNKITSLLHY